VKRTRRTTRIKVETERFLLVTEAATCGVRVAFCDGCGAESRLVTTGEAAQLGAMSERTIFQLIERRALHFNEQEDGRILVCFNSLVKESRREKKHEGTISN